MKSLCRNAKSWRVGVSSLCVALGVFFAGSTSVTANDQTVPIRWETTYDVARDVTRRVEFKGDPAIDVVEGDLEFKAAPVVVIVGVAVLATVAGTAVELVRNLLYGGFILTVENGEVVVRNDRRLPGGTIVVHGADLEVYRSDQPDSSGVTAALVEALLVKSK